MKVKNKMKLTACRYKQFEMIPQYVVKKEARKRKILRFRFKK